MVGDDARRREGSDMATGVGATAAGYSGTPLARKLGIQAGSIKVCAVSDVWSGLKLVVRKELKAVSR
jgi:hypothetical protein